MDFDILVLAPGESQWWRKEILWDQSRSKATLIIWSPSGSLLGWKSGWGHGVPSAAFEGKRRRGRQWMRWHHQLNAHELEQTRGDSEGRGSLGGCSPQGLSELDTTDQHQQQQPYMVWRLNVKHKDFAVVPKATGPLNNCSLQSNGPLAFTKHFTRFIGPQEWTQRQTGYYFCFISEEPEALRHHFPQDM